MTLPLPLKTFEIAPRRRMGRWLLLVLLAGMTALGGHVFTGHRAARQLREAGFETQSVTNQMGARLMNAGVFGWRQLFQSQPSAWNTMDSAKAGTLLNFDAVAAALRRVNPEILNLYDCHLLENVDGLKGLTSLQSVHITGCDVLQNLDGLKGLPTLKALGLSGCHTLQNGNALKGLSGLHSLILSDYPSLENLDALKGFNALRYLYLSDCVALQDVNGIKEIVGLQRLDLYRCPSLQNVDALKGLTSLIDVNLQGCTKLPPEQVEGLRMALPRTTILYP